MERLTTNKNVSEIGMYELAHNCCYIGECGEARYRDFSRDIDARELARNIMCNYGIWEIDDNVMLSDDVFDDEMMDNLMYCPEEMEGLIALFYRNLWAMADLREHLKAYEDAEEQGLILRLPFAIGNIVYRINKYADEPIIPMGVTSIEIKGITDTFKEMKCKECGFGGELTYRFSDIGKTVFLTKEEAEQALAEMKEV